MKRISSLVSALGLVAATLASPLALANVSGAIYTSVFDGTEVNFNIYPSKEAVYLNGGPGKGAETNAPGLRADGVADGVYVFMVTSPNGQTLLSTDIAACRRVQVTGGLVVGIAAADPLDPTTVCAAPNIPHANGTPQAGGATAVQLMPYDDTPNPGGEYKAWLTPAVKYVCPFNVVSCDLGRNGFINSESKTDNFKVGGFAHEVDTRFWYGNQILDHRMVTWHDTLGASNVKWSYYDPARVIMHEAHVEAPEIGTHYISIPDQSTCKVGSVYVDGAKTRTNGPQTVAVRITKGMLNKGTFTVFIDVYCTAIN
jgi:hypothetical protein